MQQTELGNMCIISCDLYGKPTKSTIDIRNGTDYQSFIRITNSKSQEGFIKQIDRNSNPENTDRV